MDIRSRFRKCVKESAFDFAAWTCVKLSASTSPDYSLLPFHPSFNSANYVLLDPRQKFAGLLFIQTGDEAHAFVTAPAVDNHFSQEGMYVNAEGKISSLTLRRLVDASDYFKEDPIPNTLSRLWRKAHISMASLTREDGAPDNEAAERVLHKIASAYRKARRIEPFLTHALRL